MERHSSRDAGWINRIKKNRYTAFLSTTAHAEKKLYRHFVHEWARNSKTAHNWNCCNAMLLCVRPSLPQLQHMCTRGQATTALQSPAWPPLACVALRFCFFVFIFYAFLCYFFCLVSRAASRSVVRVNRGNVVAVLVVKLTGKLFFFNSSNLLKFWVFFRDIFSLFHV